MIVYDLQCRENGHRFEGWFGSSGDFADQHARGLVTCPHCGGSDVVKAVMAPAVGRKGNQASSAVPAMTEQAAPMIPELTAPLSAPDLPAPVRQALDVLATLQAAALKDSRWVGKDFAEQSRAMHYGERDAEIIHGQATMDEARELAEEGVAVMPLLFPVIPPEQAN
ncbi:MAG: hypothetical protein RIQ99_715 [Pseudomonadota bacterium]